MKTVQKEVCTSNQFHRRFDPVLMLSVPKPDMINKNQSVLRGIANGSKARIIKVQLKKGCSKRKIKMGCKIITAVTVNDVERIVLKHENHSISPKLFTMQPQSHSFMANVPLPNSLQPGEVLKTQQMYMTGTQLNIISNNATTGHKLQGVTLTSLLIHTATKG
jgi:hypothetical protein